MCAKHAPTRDLVCGRNGYVLSLVLPLRQRAFLQVAPSDVLSWVTPVWRGVQEGFPTYFLSPRNRFKERCLMDLRCGGVFGCGG